MQLSRQAVKDILFQVDLASAAILDIYRSSDFRIELKKDNSPVTLADKTSNKILISSLSRFYPDVPVISEEAESVSYKTRRDWPYFWLIDPLDGTKEFIAKSGDFTINLALLKKNKPIFGVIAAPQRGVVYFAEKKGGAYKKEANKSPEPIIANKKTNESIIVVRTRMHKNKKEEEAISKIGSNQTIELGSSLKFCFVAEGKADIYLRGGPTMEWDTAAGHCIAAEAGAKIYTLSGQPFLYNKKSLLNPGLICTANKEILDSLEAKK